MSDFITEPEKISMALVEEQGGYLFLQRAQHKSSPLKWAPPAGHVKEGEDSVHADVRELYEETGIVSKAPPLYVGRIVNEKFDVDVFYHRFDGHVVVRLSPEHLDYAFVLRELLAEQFSGGKEGLLRGSSRACPKSIDDYTKTTQQLFNEVFSGRITLPVRQRLKT